MTTADKANKRRSGQRGAIAGQSGDGLNRLVSDWKANPVNPRVITDEQLEALRLAMGEFGDLSGLVVNVTTGHMIGGHQRVKVLGNQTITVQVRYPKPTKVGTVAEGFVIYNGERFTYREVEWNETKERAAMIAANKHGGEFDDDQLKALLQELNASEFDMMLTGFMPAELEAIFADKEKARGGLLAVLKISIDDPTHKVEAGQIWRAGHHAVCCLDVFTDWPTWSKELNEGDIFLPYAGALMLLTETAKANRFVIVNPDPYVCALMLDKYVEAGLGVPEADK